MQETQSIVIESLKIGPLPQTVADSLDVQAVQQKKQIDVEAAEVDTSEEEEASINKPKESFEAANKLTIEDMAREKKEKAEEQTQRCALRKEILQKMENQELKLEVDRIALLSQPQNVAQYAQIIVENQVQRESLLFQDKLRSSSSISEAARAVAVSWCIKMHGSFKVKEESLFVAIGVLDRYLDLAEVQRKDLEAVVAGAFFLASKYNDIDFIALEDVLEGAKGDVTRE